MGPPMRMHLRPKRCGNGEYLKSVAEVTRIGETPWALRGHLQSWTGLPNTGILGGSGEADEYECLYICDEYGVG